MSHELDPRFIAGVDMLRRIGVSEFVVGHTSTELGEPELWWAHVRLDDRHRPNRECAAGLDPVTAVIRLCEQLIDGGLCIHCGLVTALDASDDVMQVPGMCVYGYDPELKTFRRECEGRD